jgi:hypothetical protein
VSDASFRRVLLATAVMNVGGFFVLAPPWPQIRQLVGIPEAPPLYGWLLALWVLFFGLGYLRLAFAATEERLFLQVCAAGKTSFVVVLALCWLRGELPVLAPLAASPDLVFAGLFVARLYRPAEPRLAL